MHQVAYPTSVHLSISELHDHLVALQLPLVGCQQVLQGSQLRLQPLNLFCCCVFPPEGTHQGLLSIVNVSVQASSFVGGSSIRDEKKGSQRTVYACTLPLQGRNDYLCHKLVTMFCNTAWRPSPQQPLLASHATKACDNSGAVHEFCPLFFANTGVAIQGSKEGRPVEQVD